MSAEGRRKMSKSAKKKSDYVFIRVSPEEKARWKAAADSLCISLSDYLRLCANGAIQPPKPPPGGG